MLVKYLTVVMLLFLLSQSNNSQAQTHYYDNLHRLDSIAYADEKSIVYTYDAVGNRIGSDIVYEGVTVSPRVFLQGAYDGDEGEMHDKLRQQNFVPTTEPYTDLGYMHTNGGGGEVAQAVTFLTENSDAIVDWVVIELRDKEDHTTVVASLSALVQKDGDVVATDGFSPVHFTQLEDDNYYVAIRHRNHLGVMTGSPLLLSGSSLHTVDFTNPSTPTFGINAQVVIDGKAMLWSGNAKSDDNYVRATPQLLPPPSLASDLTYILDEILSSDPNSTFTGYSIGDLNMDGKVRVKPLLLPPPGIPSDATFLLDEVLESNPNLTRSGTID